MHISQKKELIKRFGVDLKRFCREEWGGGLHSIQSKLASCSETISFQPQVSFDCFFCFLSTEWLMVLFLYNPLGVTNSIGSNSHMESVESDGKEREIKEIKTLLRQSFLFTVVLILIFSFSVSKDGWEDASGNQWKDLYSSDSKKILKK